MNRSLALSAKATRELEAAIDEVVAGKFQRAVERLAGMLGWRHTPEVQKVRRVEVVQPRSSGEHPALERLRESPPATITVQGHEYALAPRTVTPLPKPQKRVVDRDVVAEFRATHQRCAVLGCPNGDADPHHIWPRGRGGPDETFNLMPLCPGPLGHHEEIERIDAEAFAAKYASRLPPIYLLRIKHALVAEAEKKLADRPAIDLDAEGL